MNLKRLAVYGRVSSEEQAENQYAAEQQLAYLRTTGVDDRNIYFDIESGQSEKRKFFILLTKAISAGEFDEVVVTRWDRVSRNLGIYNQFKELLQEKNVTLRLLDQGAVDFETATGELSADLQALLAVHEVRMLRERVSKGHAYRRSRKAPFGRPPWGYRSVNEKLELDKAPIICLLDQRPDNYETLCNLPDNSLDLVQGISKSEIAREAVDLFLTLRRLSAVLKALATTYGVRRKSFVSKGKEKHRGIRELMKEVHPSLTSHQEALKKVDLVTTKELLFWRQSNSLIEWFKNPVLRGHLAYHKFDLKTGNGLPPDQWELHYDVHPDQRLISDEEYSDILSILKTNSRHIGTPGSTYYLTGLIYCGACGAKMVMKNSRPYRYYGCRHGAADCGNRKNIRSEKLDEAIISAIFQRAMSLPDSETVCFDNPDTAPEVIELRDKITDFEQLVEKYPTAQEIKQTLQTARKELKILLDQFGHLNFDKASAQDIIRHPNVRQLAFWFALTQEERKIVYDKLVKQVLVVDGTVTTVHLHI